MGLSNLRLGLENKHAVLRGEIRALERERSDAQTQADRLPELVWQIRKLEDLARAAEALLKHDDPDWAPTLVAPRKKREWTSLFRPGDRGRIALSILREAGGDEWMRPLDVAITMLDQINHDPEDRVERQRLANSLGNYFKKHEGDLVESRGKFAKEWRVIRRIRG